MNREEKQEVVESLVKQFGAAQVALCADYRGLTVAQVTELRKALNKTGTRARVVKNTLARISLKRGLEGAKQAEVERFLKIIKGPSFVAFNENDPVAPAKVFADFIKKGGDKLTLKIKGAWVDGVFLDEQGVQSLSKMPGKAETLAQLLALMNTPATQLLRLIKEPSAQVVRVVEAQRANLEKKAA